MHIPFSSCTVSRRSFLGSAIAAASSAGMMVSPVTRAVAKAVDDMEVTTWSSCVVNCGSRCPLRVVSKHGQIIRIDRKSVV